MSSTSQATSGPDSELEDFIQGWAKAIVANDVERMAQFVTDDWVLIDGPGVISRERFHAAVASGALRHDSMNHEVIDIRRLGPDVALLVTRARSAARFQGQQVTADEWTTDALVRTADGWRCALTQLTPVQP